MNAHAQWISTALLTLVFLVGLSACQDSPTTPETLPIPAPSFQTTLYDCSAQSDIPQAECQALVDLYISTDGPNWIHDDDPTDDWPPIAAWLVGSPCNWGQVACADGHVSYLALFNMGLNGTIPASIGDLRELRSLTLSGNDLHGPIPSSLGNLARLHNLRFGWNQLTGTIPETFGNLTLLEHLNLSHNQLTGEIPASIGDLSLLWALNLNHNQLSGTIPASLGNVADLFELHLQNNQLGGSIPAALGKLSNLAVFDLSSNQLTGSIPDELESISHVVYILLNDNQLTGSIPAGLTSSPYLAYLYLDTNQLKGLVPLPVAQNADGLIPKRGYCKFVPGNEDLYIPDTPEYRAADVASDGICGLMLTSDPTVVTEDLEGEVADLLAEGTINAGQANALATKLTHAQEKAEEGRYQVALNLAQAFLSQVQDLVVEGVLSAAEAQPLITKAEILITLCSEMLL